ncbi:MAG: hypothetical protein ACKOVA_09925 [Novosphingobium sp.]
MAQPASAQSLSLDDVISLSKTGIGDDAIIAKIRSSDTHIDLSVDQMVDLKTKGVSGPVIAALLAEKKPAEVKMSVDSPDPAVPHPAGVYLMDSAASKMTRIDPVVTNQAKTGGLLGYAFTAGIASMSVKASIQNPTARTHASEARPSFYFFFDESNPSVTSNTAAWASGTAATVTSPSEFTLVQLMAKKDRREARVGSVNIAGAKTGVMDKDQLKFDYKLVRPGVYLVQPMADLPKGEYGFMYSLTGGGTAGAITARIFDFSI